MSSKTISTPPIAQGRTAEVYPWDDGHVLKLYRDWCPPDWAQYEARIARAIFEAGVPSAAAGAILEVDGRWGIVYERLDGISMLADMNARPWMLLKHARSLAELQLQIHRQTIPGLPSYKDHLRHDINSLPSFPQDLRQKILNTLDSLPDGNNVCHGDYHPGNVLLTRSGPVVIDWMTACSGSPWTDVARTSMILEVGARAAGKQVSPLIRAAVGFYRGSYLKRYKALSPEPGAELEHWKPVVALARLAENISPEREALIKIVKEGVAE